MSCGNGCGCCPKCGCRAPCTCGKRNEPLFESESASDNWSTITVASSKATGGDFAPEYTCTPTAEENLCDCGKKKICDCK